VRASRNGPSMKANSEKKERERGARTPTSTQMKMGREIFHAPFHYSQVCKP
jgi:hypothetical protein